MRASRCIALLLAVIAAVTLAACGGGGSTDQTKGLSPAQILQRARANAEALDSYRAGLTAEVQVTGSAGLLSGPARQLLGNRLKVNGQANVSRDPDAMSLDFAIEGLPFQGNATKIGGKLYLSVLGNDLELTIPPDQLALIRSVELAPTLVGWIRSPREVGRESIDGTKTVHLEGTLDADAVVNDVTGLLRRFPALVPSQAEIETARRQIHSALRKNTAEVWVGTGDLRPHRVRVTLALAGRLAVLPGISAASLDLTADLSRFDEPVQITAPANPRPVSPSELLGVLGIG